MSIEPAQALLKTNYTVYTIVVKIEEKKQRQYLSGVGAAAEFQETSLGWYVHLKGSYEAIYLGPEKPDYKLGDQIRITFEKVEPDAKP